MTIKTSLLSLVAATTVVAPLSKAATAALDNADFSNYAPQPNHNWSPINGGFGYNTWTTLSGASGGGTYMEGVGVNGRQVEGNFSFALYSGSGTFAISRPLSSSIGAGEFDIITRFDLAGAGPNLVNLRAGNDLNGFGNGELLSFGIVNDSQLSYTDGSGLHTLPSGESRGSVWAWDVIFNGGAGTYTGSVTNLGGGFAAVFTGNLDASQTSVGSFGVINSSTGNNQNLIFDVPQFTVIPEPVPVALLSLGAMLLALRPGPAARRADRN